MSSMYCVGLYPQSGDRGLGRTVMGAAEFSELECCMGMRAACLSHILSVIQSSFVSRGRPVSWFSGSLCSLRRWCRYRWWLECVLWQVSQCWGQLCRRPVSCDVRHVASFLGSSVCPPVRCALWTCWLLELLIEKIGEVLQWVSEGAHAGGWLPERDVQLSSAGGLWPQTSYLAPHASVCHLLHGGSRTYLIKLVINTWVHMFKASRIGLGTE